MKEKMRKALGFLGLIEDEYGDYASASPSRPFSDQPVEEEPEWSRPSPNAPRQFPTVATGSTNFRSAPTAPTRGTPSISVLEPQGQAPRIRPVASNGLRGITPMSQDRDVAIFTPTDYNESGRVTDLLRSNRAVVIVTTGLDTDVRRRLIDFAAGTVYAMNASIEVLEKGVAYLVSPQGTHLSPDVRRRLRESNYQSTGF